MTDVNYENIERYLSGSMTDKERLHFEEELGENEELAQELHFYQYVNRSITECLKSPISKKQRKDGGHKQALLMSSIRWVALAAISLLLSIVAFWSPWRSNNLLEAEAINISDMRSEGNRVEAKYASIMKLLNEGKYKEALPLLNTAVTDTPDDLAIRYYRGLTSLHLKYLSSARRDLIKVYTENGMQKYEAAYYIALSYTLEVNEHSADALKWLAKIPQDAPIYAKAKALKKKL